MRTLWGRFSTAIRSLLLAASAAAAFAATTPALAQGESYGPVRSGETLSTISRELSARLGVDATDLSYALYAANRRAFLGGDMNRLRLGARLSIPTPAEVPELAAAGRARAVEKSVEIRRAAAAEPPPRDPLPEPLEVVPPPATSLAEAEPRPQPFEPPATVVAPPAEPLPPVSEPQQPAPFANTVNSREAQRLIASKQAALALELLASLEDQYAGDPDYDYLYGVAALDSGAPTEALYPLRRAVESRPERLGARVDLGRAHFEVGDYAAAKRVFDALRRMNPPADAAAVIESYQLAIRRADRRDRRTFSGFLGAETGFDSNANAATDLSVIAIGNSELTLEENARATESPYFGAQINGQFSQPLRPRWRFVANGDISTREYSDASFVSRLQLGGESGIRYSRGGFESALVINAAMLQLDGEENLDVTGVTATAGMRPGKVWKTTLALSRNALRYTEAFSARDVDQTALALRVLRLVQLMRGGRMSFGVNAGTDEEVESPSPFGRDFFGIDGDLVVAISPRVQLRGEARVGVSDYNFNPQDSAQAREDVIWSTEFGANLMDNRWRGWLMRVGLRYSQNNSDVDFYDYDRFDLGVSIRRFFD